ncbi:MAG TPA: efflux RND transporter permease subunit, partial [Mesotoga sp.]|nr:efflux RND transporter permease subunit [Mesotoga sp.]
QQVKGEGYEWIKSLPIDSLLGSKTYVGVVSSMEIRESPSTIEHFDNQRVGYVKADVMGRPLGQVVEEVRSIIDGRDGLAECQLKGQGDLIEQIIEQFGFALLAGIVFMYLIIGAQFESLVYPLVIFCTLPMALVGVVVVSYLFNLTINISSLVGVLTLAGVIVNNGIVMITQINQLREGGMQKREAILEGAGRRARPILMTSLTTVVALLPTAFIKSEGSELESPLALIIAGGLLVGTLFTLLLTPVLYDLIDNLSVRFKKKSPIQ